MKEKWPDRCIHSELLAPIPFHLAQNLAWDSNRRTVALIAGSQGGKTSFGPWLLRREVDKRGAGDYIACTATYDLFKLKMLPAMLDVFEHILGIGRYWTGDRVIELKAPDGEFMAKRSSDKMWGRIILRSADALSGLESSTSNAAWLDECGQDRFTFDAFKAVRRRLALRRGRIFMTTTLYNLGWMVTNIIDKSILGGTQNFYETNNGEIEYTDNEKTNTTLVQFDSIVNPAFPKDEYQEQKELLPEEEFNMFYRGRKASRRLLIFNNFNASGNCIIPPFEVPESWQRYIGLDFGPVHTACVYYAEDPESHKLYAYREYMGGDQLIKDHVYHILDGEPKISLCVGGSTSEGQWRMEFGWNGLQVNKPDLIEVDLGINRVYAQHADDGIIYFSTLHGILEEKNKYRRKRDSTGVLLSEIQDKNKFHYLDAERYIISTIRPGRERRAKIRRLGVESENE